MMVETLKHGTFAGLTRAQAFCYVVLPGVTCITVVMAIVAGVTGGPGILFFVQFGLFCAFALGIVVWSVDNKRRTRLVLVLLVAQHVIRNGLRAVPNVAMLIAVCVIASLIIRRWQK